MTSFAQVTFNALSAAGVYLLVAMGFSLILGTSRFFHFAHAGVLTVGPYLAWAGKERLGLPLGPAAALGILGCIATGCLLDLVVYRHLRRRQASALVFLLASLGLYILLQNSISVLFGDDAKTLVAGEQVVVTCLGARVSPTQFLILLTATGVSLCLWVFLRTISAGRALRAVGTDPELARLCGIESGNFQLFAFALGSGLAGVGGVLLGMNSAVVPTMGMQALMMAVVVVIVAGTWSVPSLVAASLLLAATQQAATWFIGAEWQDTAGFLILVCTLLLRPQAVNSFVKRRPLDQARSVRV